MILRSIKLTLILIFVCFNAYATTYYVATTGSDSDTGLSIGNAFLTIQKGVDMATSPGDTVLVSDGTYPAGFSKTLANGSGTTEATKNITGITSANPAVVTVTSHGYSNGDKVAIYGLDDPNINGMVALNNRLFTVANAATNTFELSGFNTSSGYDPYITGGTVQRITPITIKATNRQGAVIDSSTTITGWSNSGQPANTYLSTASASSSSSLWKVGRTTLLIAKSSAGQVTSENTYYFNPTNKTFLIYTTSNPNSSTYKQGGSSEISIKGASYIVVDGFDTQYGSVNIAIGYSSGFPTPAGQDLLGPTHHNFILYCRSFYSSTWGAAVQTAATNLSSYNTFDNITIGYVDEAAGGQNGHCFKCAANNNADNGSYTTIVDSTLHDCRYHGIQSSNAWANNFFGRNRIYNVSLASSGSGAGIRCGWSGDAARPMACRVFDNDIGNGSGGVGNSIGTGIYIQDTNVNSQLWRNNIHDHIFHGVYIFYAGSGPTAAVNAKLWNNLIWNNGSSGIKVDSSTSVHIWNNSFFNNGEVVLYGAGATIDLNANLALGIDLQNNIISNVNAKPIYAKVSYSLYPSNNNLLYRSSGFSVVWNSSTYTSLVAYNEATEGITAGGLDQDSVTGDPLYAAPASGDFRIPSPTTPADVAGANLSAYFNTDYTVTTRQSPWDIGAYNTQGNLVIYASASPSSLFPTRSGNVTFSFTTTSVSIASTDKIEIIMPDGFVLSSGGATEITSVTGIDGTFSSSINIPTRTMTFTRNGDGSTVSAGAISFQATFIQNPGTSGLTDVFKFYVKNSSDTVTASNENVSGVIISDIAPGTISGAIFNGGIFS
jgi:hypothetical protein